MVDVHFNIEKAACLGKINGHTDAIIQYLIEELHQCSGIKFEAHQFSVKISTIDGGKMISPIELTVTVPSAPQLKRDRNQIAGAIALRVRDILSVAKVATFFRVGEIGFAYSS